MAIIEQKIIPSSEWVSVNELTGVAVGTEMEISVVSTYGIQLWEGIKPSNDFLSGKPLTNMTKGNSSVYISSGSLEIWAICSSPQNQSKISVAT